MAHSMLLAMTFQSAPALIACLAGIGIALHWRPRLPKIATLVVGLLSIRIAITVANIGFTHWMYTSIEAGSDAGTMGLASGVVSFFSSVLGGGVLFGLSLMVFSERRTDTQRPEAPRPI